MKRITLVVLLSLVGCGDPQPNHIPDVPSGAVGLGRLDRYSYPHGSGRLFDAQGKPKEHLYQIFTHQKDGFWNDDNKQGAVYTVRGYVHGKIGGWCWVLDDRLYIEQPNGSYQSWKIVED